MSQSDLLILTASFVVSLVIATWGAWSNAKAYYALRWDREIAPAVHAKGVAEGYRKGFSAGRVEMVKFYGKMKADVIAQRTVAAILNRN